MNRTDLDEVIAEAAPALLGYFLRRVPSAEDAADLVGETLATAWRARKRAPRDPEPARLWLFGVARNVLRHHDRTGLRRDALVMRLARAVEEAERNDQDIELDVRAAVDALPGDLAELVRLIHWDGFTVAEAAVHLGIGASTARSRHARAKELLRGVLTPVEP